MFGYEHSLQSLAANIRWFSVINYRFGHTEEIHHLRDTKERRDHNHTRNGAFIERGEALLPVYLDRTVDNPVVCRLTFDSFQCLQPCFDDIKRVDSQCCSHTGKESAA